MRDSPSYIPISSHVLALALALAASACTAEPERSAAEPPQPVAARPAPAAPVAPAVTTCPDENPLKNAYFGDLHDHTAFSYDAYTFETRVEPMQAYGFAKGILFLFGN